jgi:ParE toxin of type II toxin-antitoxin system, parDE
LVWQIMFDDSAKKDLARLDKQIAKRITAFMHERVAPLDNPRSLGEPLLRGICFLFCNEARLKRQTFSQTTTYIKFSNSILTKRILVYIMIDTILSFESSP